MLDKTVRATKEIISLNKCARSIEVGEVGKVIKSVENKKGFGLLVKFENSRNKRSVVHFKIDKFNRNKLEVI